MEMSELNGNMFSLNISTKLKVCKVKTIIRLSLYYETCTHFYLFLNKYS